MSAATARIAASVRLPRRLRRDARRASPSSDARIVIVVNDSIGSSKLVGLPQALAGADDQRRHRRAEHGRRRLRPRQRRQDPVRQRRLLLPDRTRAGADQGRRRLHATPTSSSSGSRPGVGYGELGPTHHSIEDFAWLRRLAQSRHRRRRADPWETAEAVKAAAAHDGPVFLRVSRFGVPQAAAPRRRAVRDRQGRDAARGHRRRDHRLRRHGHARARGGRRARREAASAPASSTWRRSRRST